MGEIINTSGQEFADFDMPSLQCNADGWGPCGLSDTFRDMPYQPFSKSDRMGKISDWTGSAALDKKFPSKLFILIEITQIRLCSQCDYIPIYKYTHTMTGSVVCIEIFHFNNQIIPTDKYASQFGTGSQYAYYHDEDETTFHLVDTARVQKPPYQRGRFRGNMRNMRWSCSF